MTSEQKNKIGELRKAGYGYAHIASSLGITKNQVVSYCHRNSLAGEKASHSGSDKPAVCYCKNCGKPIWQTPGRKPLTVTNPDGGPHKKEITPGDGMPVGTGQEIIYEITWQNTEAEPADITIRDPLDPGVDFVSASDGGIYDAATHTVFWNLGKQPAGAVGKVTLTVRVNEKSLEKGEVDNQAFVKVGDNPEQATKIPQNPVEPPETPTPTPPTTPPTTPPIPWWPWWPKNTPTPTPAPSGTPAPTLDHELPPRTGDEAPIGLVAALAAIAAIGLAGTCTALLVRRKKRKTRKE